jgi:hypothetical protein
MALRPALLAVVICLVSLPRVASAQSFTDYMALVNGYATAPEAVSLTFSRWAVPTRTIRDHVTACLPRSSGFSGQLSPCSDRWGLAVMLHSETAQVLIDSQEHLADFHIEMAQQLLPALVGRPDVVIDWYRFMVMLNLSRGRTNVALDLAARAADKFPKHPEGFVLRGLVREGSVMFNNPNLRDVRSNDSQESGSVDYGSLRRNFFAGQKLLGAAAADFRQALAIAPKLLEARLHLARVWVVLDDERGPAALKAIAADAPDYQSRYLAQMFLGDVAERANLWPEAAAAYRAARAIGPEHQSACVALSYVAGRIPGEENAEALASECVDLEDSFDPWWLYRTSAQDPAVLARLRIAVRTP